MHAVCRRLPAGWVRVERMGPGKYENAGKSQSVPVMINPTISTRPRMPPSPPCSGRFLKLLKLLRLVRLKRIVERCETPCTRAHAHDKNRH
eukprot:COSAG01_NODE_1441_length_10293_cov_4.232392_13_plen_91_part_00